jgi:hypothetical protein
VVDFVELHRIAQGAHNRLLTDHVGEAAGTMAAV